MPHNNRHHHPPAPASRVGVGRGLARAWQHLKTALKLQSALKQLEGQRGFMKTMPAPGADWHAVPASSRAVGRPRRTQPDPVYRQAATSSAAQLLELEGAPPQKQCPVCSGQVLRANRRPVDRLISCLVPVHRYRCISFQCGWVGNMRLAKPVGANPLRWRIAASRQLPALSFLSRRSRQ